jgi:hypothetical protein
MSPAAIPEELLPQLDLHQDQLQAAGKAFDALLLTLYRLTHRHNDLKKHTKEAFKQVLTPFSSAVSFSSPLPIFPGLAPTGLPCLK